MIEIFYLSVNILQMPVGWYLSFSCHTKRDKFRDFAILLHIISEFQAKQKVSVNFLHYPGVILHENDEYWSVTNGDLT